MGNQMLDFLNQKLKTKTPIAVSENDSEVKVSETKVTLSETEVMSSELEANNPPLDAYSESEEVKVVDQMLKVLSQKLNTLPILPKLHVKASEPEIKVSLLEAKDVSEFESEVTVSEMDPEAKDPILDVFDSKSEVSELEAKIPVPDVFDSESKVKVSVQDVKVHEPENDDSAFDVSDFESEEVKVSEPDVQNPALDISDSEIEVKASELEPESKDGVLVLDASDSDYSDFEGEEGSLLKIKVSEPGN